MKKSICVRFNLDSALGKKAWQQLQEFQDCKNTCILEAIINYGEIGSRQSHADDDIMKKIQIIENKLDILTSYIEHEDNSSFILPKDKSEQVETSIVSQVKKIDNTAMSFLDTL